jgi:Spy/CpxP family protein refolding chaperone
MMDTADQNKQLADQIAELRAQVARLQAAVAQIGPGKKVTSKSGMQMSPAPNKGMGMMDDKSAMGMPPGKGAMTSGSAAMGMKDDQGEMGGMSPGMSMMDDKDEMSGMSMGSSSNTSPAPAPAMGMCCMGGMAAGGNAAMSAMPPAAGGMATMSGPSSATPGQAGASHLYHVGSTGFFLNHSQHITLTADQKFTLNRLKERAMLHRASEQRKIDQAEQELYTLTGADQLDNSKVQEKIGEIEKLRAEQRMNFIRAVGEASIVLTHDQHQALMGTMAGSKQ